MVASSGCAISTPLGPIFGASDDQVSTGSITPRDGRFSNNMTDEDWTRARSAVQSALAAPVATTPAAWDNPSSGLRGTVSSVATPFAVDGSTCQAFLATLVEGTDLHWYQGRACRSEGTPWAVVDTARWLPPARS